MTIFRLFVYAWPYLNFYPLKSQNSSFCPPPSPPQRSIFFISSLPQISVTLRPCKVFACFHSIFQQKYRKQTRQISGLPVVKSQVTVIVLMTHIFVEQFFNLFWFLRRTCTQTNTIKVNLWLSRKRLQAEKSKKWTCWFTDFISGLLRLQKRTQI